MKINRETLPIAIIGAGPIGLAAAAHLFQNDQDFVLFENKKVVGASLLTWGHVSAFSPWEFNIDKVAERLLRNNGVDIPNKNDVPLGKEIVENYLKPLSEIKGIQEKIHLNTKVLSIGRKGLDKMKDSKRDKLPFSIQVLENGNCKIYEAKAIIDASGTWQNPNPAGSGGVFAIGEQENANHFFYGMPDIKGDLIERYANKEVLVVGGGHSAIGTILALSEIQTEYPLTKVHWLLRKNSIRKVYGGQKADGFKSRGELGVRIENIVNSGQIAIHTPVHIHQFKKSGDQLTVIGIKKQETFVLHDIDEIICNTGSRPDFGFLREIRFDSDAALESVVALAPLIDPNIHSCGTVRAHGENELRQKEKDFYIVGMKSYGRAPTFLMATGYEQVRSIIAYMNGDLIAAQEVHLKLPETGVCNSGLEGDNCCDNPAPVVELKVNPACCSVEDAISSIENCCDEPEKEIPRCTNTLMEAENLDIKGCC